MVDQSAWNRREFLAAGMTLAASSLTGACLQSRSSSLASEGPLVELLARQLPTWMAELRVPGLGIVLLREGEVAWHASFGVAEAGSRRPIDATTVFEAASMSKPVFAAAIFRLHEQGVIDVDRPLADYDTTTVGPVDARTRKVTARQVLSHTGGLPGWRSGDRPLTLQFAPGERWEYSGEGYFWLQSVVTGLQGRVGASPCGTYEGDLRVCGSDVDEVLARLVLRPAGMSGSRYRWPPEGAANAAVPHNSNGSPMPKRPANAADVARYAAAGGLHCPVADYASFLSWILTDGHDHLKPTTVADMVRPVIAVSETPWRTSWASGWQVLHTDVGDLIAHGGDNPGYHCYAAASRPLRSGFVVMTNSDGATALLPRLLTPAMLSALITGPVT